MSLIFCFNYFSCNSCLSILIFLNHIMLWTGKYFLARILIEELCSKRSFLKADIQQHLMSSISTSLIVPALSLLTRLVACSLYPKLPFLSIFSSFFHISQWSDREKNRAENILWVTPRALNRLIGLQALLRRRNVEFLIYFARLSSIFVFFSLSNSISVSCN